MGEVQQSVDTVRSIWPAYSLEQIESMLCATGAPFEMEEVVIRGVPTRTWKNVPPTLAALAHIARSHGARCFTVHEDERVSYDAFFRATATLAHALAARGVGRGDRVAIAMRNLPEWPVAFFAATAIGAIAVPLNAWWTGSELEYALRDSGTRLLICDAERHARIAPHLSALPDLTHVIVSRTSQPIEGAELLDTMLGDADGWAALPDTELPEIAVEPDDAATIFYTSGTTGHPKGALGTHRNILTNILSTAYASARAALRRGDMPLPATPKTLLLVIPLFHVTACNAALMGAVFGGSTLVFMRRWDTVKAFELIERERVNSTGGVPTIAWQLLEHPERANYDLSSLETISYGGAPSAPELVRRIQAEFGCMPGNGWGMTETSATVTSHVAEDYQHRPESCGPAVPVAELRIIADDGVTALPPGEVGEIWARGPQIVAGYWNKPEATAATFIDGWVRTGDLGRLDEEGFCYIVDRAKDIIIRGGENIYSSEVENFLYDHPAVTDAALVGLSHRTLGEEPAAVVHLGPGMAATEAELQDWVRARLAAFKIPVRVLFCDDTLPRNANGKILKKELKALFDQR
ncbi:class I adenylate-forming enzyme family protein [Sphingomonas cavernae]|uniref:3-methylmercaptopropionyl-CoA ligase n=1 Tax=Sphingomonas cavernae TaxID=2320861 RepID=A0A418WQW1_9SPHN|nr:class I adenylate-forming enzyme family protein [Sphingomonas cavernae]RJF93601.1 long-chain fatty acid--CoA ligase [Sphingomonas cavernae]